MKKSNNLKYMPAALAVFTFSLLLWILFPAGSFAQGAASGVAMQTVSGKVVETMISGGYTYARVEKDRVDTWVALPKTNLAVGDEIACREGMVMRNFQSPSLRMTFRLIVFSSGLTSYSSGGSPPAEGQAAAEPAAPVPKPKPVDDWGEDF